MGGAHVVRGGILAKYLKNGGPSFGPLSGKRELGFPKENEKQTPDGVAPVQHFEWGAIYFCFGGNVLYGDLYIRWNALNRSQSKSPSPYGYPIDDQQVVAGGAAAFFERGAWWVGGGHGTPSQPNFVQWQIKAPRLGHPAIVTPESSAGAFPISIEVEPGSIAAQGPPLPPGSKPLPIALWAGRLFLSPVGKPGNPRTFIPLDCVSPASAEAAFRLRLQLPAGTHLADRTLYDLVYKNPTSGRSYTLAPHAIYSKSSWDHFGFAHITDLHVSKRLDTFREKLIAGGSPQGAQRFNNFNDNFRDFIVYANHLHDIGELDVILVTGDLVDYQFEKGDAPAAGGNFELFMRLVCGNSAYKSMPTWAPHGAEELRVPIFATLGNHDYRPNPYGLRFRVEVGPLNYPKDQYGNMNLNRGDALILVGGQTPGISSDAAAKMVAIDRELEYCQHRVLQASSYKIELGPHRIVMIDSGPDVGVPDGLWDLAFPDENEEHALQGAPDSEGVSSSEVELLRSALAEAGANSLVIVGIHAPLINPAASEFPPYFRETSLGTGPREDVLGFLLRRDRASFHLVEGSAGPSHIPTVSCSREVGRKHHPTWTQIEPSDRFLKLGTTEDLLDYGVSAGAADAVLQLCAGTGVARSADLVLSGHGHLQTEFRLTRRAAGGVHFYFDFYSDNPPEYYPTALAKFPMPEIWPDAQVLNLFQGGVRVLIGDGPIAMHNDPAIGWNVTVGKYAHPLNQTATVNDARLWWAEHRPLITQTSALGPLENSQLGDKPLPTFQGFRLGQVRDNTIAKLRTIRLSELRDQNLRMAWEPIAPGDQFRPPGQGPSVLG